MITFPPGTYTGQLIGTLGDSEVSAYYYAYFEDP